MSKWLLFAIFIAALAGRMLLTSHHFYVHDDMQVFRVNEYVKCFVDHQFPCRWSADLGKGYGYPLFNYYPPVIYLIPSLFHSLGMSIVASLNLFAFTTFLLAAYGMYLLGASVGKNKVVGFLASTFYVLFPFHAVNVFIRGVQAENFVWSLAPLILYLIWQMVVWNRWSRALPLMFAIVFLTHILSSFVLVGIALIWTILAIIYHHAHWSALIRTSITIVLGLGMAAFFYLPALVEKDLVQSNSLISGYYAYTNHFVSFAQLFTEYKWNYGASLWGALPEEMPYMVGHVGVVTLILLTIYAAILYVKSESFRKAQKSKLSLVILLLFCTGLLLFLSHFKSDPLWQLIKPLQFFQFPWRFIAWSALPLTLALVLLLTLLPQKFLTYTCLGIVAAITIYSYPFFKPRGYDESNDQQILVSDRSRQASISLYDYLPIAVKKVPDQDASSLLYGKFEGIQEGNYIHRSNYIEMDLKADSPTIVTFSQFYFPGWTGSVNEKSSEVIPDDKSGLMQIYLPQGENHVVLNFGETPLRRACDYLSLISLALYFVYLLGYNKPHA